MKRKTLAQLTPEWELTAQWRSFMSYVEGAKIGLLLMIVCILLFSGCASKPQEPCISLECIAREQYQQRYADCLRANPAHRMPGRVWYLPEGKPWYVWCQKVAARTR